MKLFVLGECFFLCCIRLRLLVLSAGFLSFSLVSGGGVSAEGEDSGGSAVCIWGTFLCTELSLWSQ